jgi:ribosomal protein L12E/L44/L45/RPP1/RPP2
VTSSYVLLQADNINTVVKAAGITVEPYWPSLFAKLFSKKSVEDLIANVGAGVFATG